MNKKPIKIVKREDRLGAREVPTPSTTVEEQEQNPTDLARTVTGWVREFKKRGNSRAERVLASLRETTPRPNEA